MVGTSLSVRMLAVVLLLVAAACSGSGDGGGGPTPGQGDDAGPSGGDVSQPGDGGGQTDPDAGPGDEADAPPSAPDALAADVADPPVEDVALVPDAAPDVAADAAVDPADVELQDAEAEDVELQDVELQDAEGDVGPDVAVEDVGVEDAMIGDDAADGTVEEDVDLPWWLEADTSPSQCEALPETPLEYDLLAGFGGSEDFAFDAEGGIVLRQGSHIVRKDMAGNTEVLIPNVGFTAGIGVLPNGDVVVAEASTLVIAFATGGYHTILAGLQYPNGLDVDHEGFVYVAEQTGGRLRKVNGANGEFEVLAEGMNAPNGVAFAPGYDRVYVGSFGGGTVVALDKLEDGTWSEPWLFAAIKASDLFAQPPPEPIDPLPVVYDACAGKQVQQACYTVDGWSGRCQNDDGGGEGALVCEILPTAKPPAEAACKNKSAGQSCSLQLYGAALLGQCLSGSGSAEGCCEAHQDTGCANPVCQECVCGADPFCCDTQWDNLCADAADGGGCSGECPCDFVPPADGDELLCAAKPNPVAYCKDKAVGDLCNFALPDGTLVGATCHELAGMDLGSSYPESGLGCVTPDDLGSWIDPQPMTWEPCVGEDAGAGCVLEDGAAGTCDAELGCVADPDADPAKVIACAGAEPEAPCSISIWGYPFTGTCKPGGAAPECCKAKNDTGCPSVACEDCVCGMDAFCCDTQWDSICADEAQNQCDDACFCSGGAVVTEGDDLACYAKPDAAAFCVGKEIGDLCNYIVDVDTIIGASCRDVSGLDLGSGFPSAGVACVPPSELDPPTGGGGLDGVQVDECGNVYVTEYVLGYVYRVSPDGEIELAAKLPATWIPNLEFGRGIGGWDDKTLYVMTIGFGDEIITLDAGVRGKEFTMPGMLP